MLDCIFQRDKSLLRNFLFNIMHVVFVRVVLFQIHFGPGTARIGGCRMIFFRILLRIQNTGGYCKWMVGAATQNVLMKPKDKLPSIEKFSRIHCKAQLEQEQHTRFAFLSLSQCIFKMTLKIRRWLAIGLVVPVKTKLKTSLKLFSTWNTP
jgi:hypothetical protein